METDEIERPDIELSEEELLDSKLRAAIRAARTLIRRQSLELKLGLLALFLIFCLVALSIFLLITSLPAKDSLATPGSINSPGTLVQADSISIVILFTISASGFSFIAYFLFTYYLVKRKAIGELRRIEGHASLLYTPCTHRKTAREN
jgi:hypothetical protein